MKSKVMKWCGNPEGTILQVWSVCALMCTFVCATVLPSSVAFAQVEGEELEPEEVEEEQSDPTVDNPARNASDAMRDRPTSVSSVVRPKVQTSKKLSAAKDSAHTWRLGLLTRAATRDNIDFRAVNDRSPQDVLNTDDKLTWGATQLRAGLTLSLSDAIRVDVGMGHNGLWGGELAGASRDSNMIFVDSVYADWRLVDVDAATVSLRLGRQYFSIGGAPKDFFFWDVVDGATFNADFKKAGRVRGIVDFAGVQLRPDELDFLTTQEKVSSSVNFNGDNSTVRTGLVYENTELLEGLEFRLFGFYSDIGASTDPRSSGADLSYRGVLGNFSDNDESAMLGTRVGYSFENEEKTMKVGAFGEYARSMGIDRKDKTVGWLDIRNEGNAYGAGVMADMSFGLFTVHVLGRFFQADGPAFTQDGIPFSHGFVSFKGAHVGGVISDDIAGWHPSAYVGSHRGVESTPQSKSRKAGTQNIHAQLGLGIKDLLVLDIGFWNLTDMGVTFAAEEDLAVISRDLPFGYSAADVDAQFRHGKTLGQELDIGFTFLAKEHLSVFVQSGFFFPGDFYTREITFSGGDALGSTNPQNAWTIIGGASFSYQ